MEFNNSTLYNAVTLYLKNETQAIKQYGCINTWNTSNVTIMSNLFKNAYNFNQDISNWNVSNGNNIKISI